MGRYREELHYQTRFELSPSVGSTKPAHQMVREELWQWLLEKERRREGPSLARDLEQADAEAAFLAGTFLLPSTQEPGARPGLVASGFEASDGRLFWAMDLNEPESGRRGKPQEGTKRRRWHTKVGVSSRADGSCAVNVYNSYYLLPQFSQVALPEPRANVPRFVKTMLSQRGYQARVGATPLLTSVAYLDAETFDTTFKIQLLDARRELPLVLMATDWSGRTPVWDEIRLAEDGILGMANVYVLDWRDYDIRERAYALFQHGEVSFDYRCGMGTLRVYRPEIDLTNARASRNHPFYSEERINSICRSSSGKPDYDRFTDVLAQTLMTSIRLGEAEVLDTDDVARMKSRTRVRELEAQLAQMRERATRAVQVAQAAKAELAAQVAQAAEAEQATRGTQPAHGAQAVAPTEPARVSAEVEGRIEELEENCAFFESYALTLEEQNKSFEAQIKQLEEKGGELEQKLGYYRFQTQAEAQRADAAEDEREAWRHMGDVISALDHVPESPVDLLRLAEDLWGSKIRITPEAWDSAKAYANGDLDEVWQIIKSIPLVLWDIYFNEENTEDRVADLYENSAGYELALTESDATRGNRAFMRERDVAYKGETVQAIAHIKGKSRRAGAKNLFRLHYYVDWDDKVIVIGHCGRHLDCAGMRRV